MIALTVLCGKLLAFLAQPHAHLRHDVVICEPSRSFSLLCGALVPLLLLPMREADVLRRLRLELLSRAIVVF